MRPQASETAQVSRNTKRSRQRRLKQKAAKARNLTALDDAIMAVDVAWVDDVVVELRGEPDRARLIEIATDLKELAEEIRDIAKIARRPLGPTEGALSCLNS